MKKLEGPTHGPHNGGTPGHLVVLLHGFGADGNDLIGLAPYWARLLPTAEFLSPNAPFPCDMAPHGYQWYSSQDRTPEAALAGVRAAAPILDAFIDEALAKRGLEPEFAEVTMKALSEVEMHGEDMQKMQKLLDALEALDDVQEVHTSAVIPEA